MRRIMVAGHISLDITPEFRNSGKQKFSELLMPGKLINVGPAKVSVGGAVSNTGLALKRLGAEAILTAKTGKDTFGKILEDVIKAADCRAVLLKCGAAGMYLRTGTEEDMRRRTATFQAGAGRISLKTASFQTGFCRAPELATPA